MGSEENRRGACVMCFHARVTPWLTDCFGHCCNTQLLPWQLQIPAAPWTLVSRAFPRASATDLWAAQPHWPTYKRCQHSAWGNPTSWGHKVLEKHSYVLSGHKILKHFSAACSELLVAQRHIHGFSFPVLFFPAPLPYPTPRSFPPVNACLQALDLGASWGNEGVGVQANRGY